VERFYRVMAAGVLAFHLAWIAWVIVGALFTRNRPALTWLHIASLVYGIAVETIGFQCPLTTAELWLMARGGLRPYEGSFLIHYLGLIVYPNISLVLLEGAGVAVCLFNLGIYLLRFTRRGAERA
jgi:Protein of Unknown function (DUF2784)